MLAPETKGPHVVLQVVCHMLRRLPVCLVCLQMLHVCVCNWVCPWKWQTYCFSNLPSCICSSQKLIKMGNCEASQYHSWLSDTECIEINVCPPPGVNYIPGGCTGPAPGAGCTTLVSNRNNDSEWSGCTKPSAEPYIDQDPAVEYVN